MSDARIDVRPFAALVIVTAFLSVPCAHASPASGLGVVEGRAIDRDTRRPIAGATVMIEGVPMTATTGSDGRFSIPRVPEGIYRLRAEATGYLAITSPEIKVSPNRSMEVLLELPAALPVHEAVVVRGEAGASPSSLAGGHRLGGEEIRRSAGTMGDVSRLVQGLPGLAVVGDLRNDLVVRGGSPSENLTIVDGIEVPTINHFSTTGTTGGVAAMINSELIADALFLAGGFPVAHGNRLSSVLDVRLREGNRSRLEFEADVNFVGAGLIAEGPVGSRGSWIAAARRSFFDLFAESAGGDVGDTFPRMTDYTGKFVFDAGPRDRIWAIVLGGSDTIRLVGDLDDLDEPDLLTIDNRSRRTTVGGAWQRLFGNHAYGVLTASQSALHYTTDVRNGMLGGATQFVDRSQEGETTIKYDAVWQPFPAWSVTGGASWKRLARHVVVAQPAGVSTPYSVRPREETAGVDLTAEADSEIRSAHAQITVAAHPRLRLTAGLRLDQFAWLLATRLSPRAGAEWRVSPALTFNLSGGRFQQHPDLTAMVSHPGNTRLDPMAADHLVAGTAYVPRPGLRVTVEAYQKWYRSYPVSLDYPMLTLANYGTGFEMEHLLLPLVSRGRGRARGVELLIKQQWTRRFYGQFAYSGSRTKHAALDGLMRTGSLDTPHVVTVIAGHRLSQWDLSGRFTAASGAPYTPPLLPVSVAQNRWVHDLSQFNAARLDTFHRLDLRVDRRLQWRRARLGAFVEIQNLDGRRGVIAYEWNEKTRAPHPVRQLGVLPVLGLNVEF